MTAKGYQPQEIHELELVSGNFSFAGDGAADSNAGAGSVFEDEPLACARFLFGFAELVRSSGTPFFWLGTPLGNSAGLLQFTIAGAFFAQ